MCFLCCNIWLFSLQYMPFSFIIRGLFLYDICPFIRLLPLSVSKIILTGLTWILRT